MSDEFELRIPVDVQAELRTPANRWAEPVPRPIGVTPGWGGHGPGHLLVKGEGVSIVHAGAGEIVLHRKTTEGVALNFAGRGELYVVMRPDDSALGARVHLVTASDYEAQDHTDAGEDMVERVPMPAIIRERIEEFLARHHVDEPFHKRKRKKDRPEEEKFGQQPIFDRSAR